MVKVIKPGEKERRRRLVYWNTIQQIASAVGTDKAQVDEVELVRWTQQNLDDIKRSLERHTQRKKGVFER